MASNIVPIFDGVFDFPLVRDYVTAGLVTSVTFEQLREKKLWGLYIFTVMLQVRERDSED